MRTTLLLRALGQLRRDAAWAAAECASGGSTQATRRRRTRTSATRSYTPATRATSSTRTSCRRLLECERLPTQLNPGCVHSLMRYVTFRATVAGDGQVRVFDVERALSTNSKGREVEFNTRDTCIRVLRCHSKRTKRIVTEESPDKFLSVAEVWALISLRSYIYSI